MSAYFDLVVASRWSILPALGFVIFYLYYLDWKG